jgi:hypothetical protein
MANFKVTFAWCAAVDNYVTSQWNATMGLYVNTPYTWSGTSSIGDLSLPGWSGYTNFTCASWTTPANDGSGDWYIVANPITWTNSDTVNSYTIYGSFLYDTISSTLIGGGNFTVPIVMGPLYSVTLLPNYQTASQY